MMLERLTALTGAPEPLERGEADPGRQAEPHGGGVEGSRMSKVLLIEDDAETAREIMAELVERGFEVEWAATGIEGLDRARAGKADALIVDRLLPGVDGLTIIEVMRQERLRTPVLVLSALGAVDDRVR